MTEEKYMKAIHHINKEQQEYIAKNNLMTENKLPPVIIQDLGNMKLWHRVSEAEQLVYEYLKKKEKEMTEEIKYNKDEKWIPYEQLVETSQQTISRLEQIIEADNKQIELDADCIANYIKEVSKLKQENKELKIYIESNKQQVEEVETLVMDNDRLQQEVENLKDVIYYDVEKYRSALEEIREIVNEPCIEGEDCETCDSNCMCKEILDKINEVLNESN